MKRKIRNIQSDKDVNLGILYYINNNVTIDMEIKNLISGSDIDVRIKSYFQNSPDYQKIQRRIDHQKKNLASLSKAEDKEAYTFEQKKLGALEQAAIEFKAGALRLAETFLTIKDQSKRLKKASDLFEKGLISEADKVLVETDLLDDQDALIPKMKYLQSRKVHLMESVFDLKKN